MVWVKDELIENADREENREERKQWKSLKQIFTATVATI